MHREDLRLLRDYIVGWMIALGMWILVRNYGVTIEAPANPEPHQNLRMLFVFGPLAGLLFGIAQIKFERYLFRRIPLWKLSLLGLLINSVIMGLIFILAYQFFKNVVGFNEPTTFSTFISNPNAILTFLYSLFVNFVMASIREVNLLLGKGNLWRFIRGDFYSPRVENRVFMFIDLKGSTTIAEQLGHIKYSRFLQDCFYDLNVIRHSGAEVYQYVGDEVVLSWRVKKNMDYVKCLKAFWAYEDELKKREEYYLDKYGLAPKFKAGINLGEVTTAEVGEIKREIAYHGDTMNIAARIQDKCNDYGRTLLVSEHFHNNVEANGIFDFELMGEEMLRGKNESLKIYAVNRTACEIPE
ncbi:MAG: adenylate/guanylate cyclase domain-containing protein [Roseivirga sp.]|nr:adenylate/guanylate cyclase domain-containing protein [Roseivirga sp.]